MRYSGLMLAARITLAHFSAAGLFSLARTKRGRTAGGTRFGLMVVRRAGPRPLITLLLIPIRLNSN
jgi:hypothetical protein